MLITNHVLAGATLGLLAPTGPDQLVVPGVVVAGTASHFLMDSLPHWGVAEPDEALPIAVVDGLVGLCVSAMVLKSSPPDTRLRVAAGIFGACLPDTDQPYQLFFGRGFHPRWLDRFHSRIQAEHGWLPQEVLVAVALAGCVAIAIHRRR
jgi:hypothetical protein